ncbi:MAG: efflux transporter outer membrane subunit [Beijerinckiaceae bacterium]
MKVATVLAAIGPAILLAACDMAPPYNPPQAEIPSKYKEDGLFIPAEPADAAPRGAWWEGFHDRELDRLELLVESANQDLAAALAGYEESRALAAKAVAALYPYVEGDGQLSGNRQSANRPLRSPNQPTYYGANTIDAQATYEVDVWGRVRDLVAASKATMEANAADFAAVRLSLQGQLARAYANLRELDLETKLLSDTIAAYRQALELTNSRLEGKIASPADVSRAQAQLATAEALLTDLRGRRTLLEHAIAVLVGQPASTFAVKPAPVRVALPVYPAGVPSTLLQRRPDIASAERRVAAANEVIGVARAAFFPRFTINLMWGTQDTELNLLAAKNILWSVGPSVSLPIFDAGARRADLAAAEAEDARVTAIYRGLVLRALREVEDNLALQHWLKREAADIDRAVTANQKTLDVSLTLYRDGAVTYLEVVTAQTALLDSQRTALLLRTQRLQASIGLILALGGGWSVVQIANLDPG